MIVRLPFEKQVTINGSYCHYPLTFIVEGSYIENKDYIAMRYRGRLEVDIEGIEFHLSENPKLSGSVMWANEWDEVYEDIELGVIKLLEDA